MIGEPEAAAGIEHEIVGSSKRQAVAVGVQDLYLATGKIDGLDAPAGVVLGLLPGEQTAVVLNPPETAVVADVDPPIRPHRGAVWPCTDLGDQALAAIRFYPGQRARGDLDQDDVAIGKGDRALWKS